MTFLGLVVLGGLVGLDGVGAGQFMISRPVVTGLLAGLLAGDPAAGVAVGLILELYLLVAVPSGGGRFPEPGPATVVGAGVAVLVGGAEGLALGVAGGLMWGLVGAWSQTMLRHLNARLVPVPGSTPVSAPRVARAHLLAMALDGLRGSLVTALGLGLAILLTPHLAAGWPLEAAATRALLLMGGLVSLGILARGDGLELPRLVLFGMALGGGLLAGSLIL